MPNGSFACRHVTLRDNPFGPKEIAVYVIVLLAIIAFAVCGCRCGWPPGRGRRSARPAHDPRRYAAQAGGGRKAARRAPPRRATGLFCLASMRALLLCAARPRSSCFIDDDPGGTM